ncbi:MAG: threonine--tRNA ligase [Acidimicrobiia bacterium]|nr:MAG: threonine--tRNA ligase [Acidimicrobiia bacterium]
MTISVRLPDGKRLDLPDDSTGGDAAFAIGRRLGEAAVAARVDGNLVDLTRPLPADAEVEIVTEDSDEGRHVLRHSAAHILAQAVLGLFEGATFAIGPAIEDGFYYDFDIGRPFTPEDLEAIEGRMAEIVAEDQPFVREEFTKATALEVFAEHPYKVEIIESVEEGEGAEGEAVSAYRNRDFIDLCRGPHLPSTGRLPAFKLLRSSGAYWRGDEKRPQLQRIYGTAWESRKALDEYLHRLEEARRRDHRRLGIDLDYFSFPDELGSGLAVWHPKGALVRHIMEDYSRRTHLSGGYQMVATPHIARRHLWETSGHVGFYAENMYPAMELDDGEPYLLKPMNCPGHILVYRSHPRSYRELPMRLYELGTVYRYERSGVLHGLLRARGFTQDDSHIFCTEAQLADELAGLLDFVLMVLRDFGFEGFEADLSTRPEKFVGRPELWDRATEALAAALGAAGLEHTVAEGEGAFYGPKIDIHVRDAIGRRWQVSTLQVDFAQPENFQLEYATADNTRERPVMIHRALFGSVERFFGILLEHYAGALPGWLAPVQAMIVPVADRHLPYASEVAAGLAAAGLRAEVDSSDETVGEKIRRAATHKHPAILVVGDQDVDSGTAGIRIRGADEERGVALGDVLERLLGVCSPPR